jgi:hypothetical protein
MGSLFFNELPAGAMQYWLLEEATRYSLLANRKRKSKI